MSFSVFWDAGNKLYGQKCQKPLVHTDFKRPTLSLPKYSLPTKGFMHVNLARWMVCPVRNPQKLLRDEKCQDAFWFCDDFLLQPVLGLRFYLCWNTKQWGRHMKQLTLLWASFQMMILELHGLVVEHCINFCFENLNDQLTISPAVLSWAIPITPSFGGKPPHSNSSALSSSKIMHKTDSLVSTELHCTNKSKFLGKALDLAPSSLMKSGSLN